MNIQVLRSRGSQSAYVVFAGLVAFTFILAWLIGKNITRKSLRLLVMALLGLATAIFFAHFVPNLTEGPFADYDDFDSTIALANIGEAQPLIEKAALHYHSLAQIGAPCSAFHNICFFPSLARGHFFALKRAPAQKAPHADHLCGVLNRRHFADDLLASARRLVHAVFRHSALTYALAQSWQHIANELFRPSGASAWKCLPSRARLYSHRFDPGYRERCSLRIGCSSLPRRPPSTNLSAAPTADFLMLTWGYGKSVHTIMAGANEAGAPFPHPSQCYRRELQRRR